MKKFFLSALAALAISCGALVFFSGRVYEAPVLMYHHVAPEGDPAGPFVSVGTFERQMEFLKLHGYKVLPLAELVGHAKTGRVPRGAVAITFDDGNLDNIQHAFPVLEAMNFPATVFMISDNLGRPGSLSAEDLRILSQSGVEIGSHTASHAFLPHLDPAGTEHELESSKAALEDLLGRPVRLFSYPAGGVTQTARAAVAKAGYEGAVTTNYGSQLHDPYALHRIKISESGGSLFNFWIKLSGFYHLGKKRIPIE